MYFITPSNILKKIYRNLVWEIPTKEKVIFLTFDDGPVPEVTPDILDILKQYKSKATFFCLGKNVEKNPEIFKKIISSGHGIGNHTYEHLNGWKTKSNDYIDNIKKCNELFKTNLFRPPYGKITHRQIKLLKNDYSIILWSVLCGDFHKKVSKEKCLNNALKFTKEGSIIVFHDSLKTKEKVLYALPRFLEYFISKGYKFDVLNSYQIQPLITHN